MPYSSIRNRMVLFTMWPNTIIVLSILTATQQPTSVRLQQCACVPVMCVTECVLVESEQLSQFLQREMSLYILLLIHHTAAQGLLMGLSLQDLLFNGAGL